MRLYVTSRLLQYIPDVVHWFTSTLPVQRDQIIIREHQIEYYNLPIQIEITTESLFSTTVGYILFYYTYCCNATLKVHESQNRFIHFYSDASFVIKMLKVPVLQCNFKRCILRIYILSFLCS